MLFGNSGDTNKQKQEGGKSDESVTKVDDRPCKVSGHRYGNWYHIGYFTRSKTWSETEMKVTQKLHRECEKCGDLDDKRVTIGEIEVTNHGAPGSDLRVTKSR